MASALEQAIKNIKTVQQNVASIKKPSDISTAVNNITNTFRKQPNIISPVPAGDTMTKGLEYYYKMDKMKSDAAKKALSKPQPTPQSRQVKYNQSIANNGGKGNPELFKKQLKVFDKPVNQVIPLSATVNLKEVAKSGGLTYLDNKVKQITQGKNKAVLGAKKQVPTASPTPTPSPVISNPTDVQKMIINAFPENPKLAIAIAMQESSLRPNARLQSSFVNRWTGQEEPIDAIGLFQINLPAHMDKVPGETYEEKAQNLMNPLINLQVARQIYDRQNWNPWEAYTSGAYQKYLKE